MESFVYGSREVSLLGYCYMAKRWDKKDKRGKWDISLENTLSPTSSRI
jgi:hypothetical protein